jgi:hypothetical protein
MTDEQKTFLASRLEQAAKAQPELIPFRDQLLRLGGVDFVPPIKPDIDLPVLLSQGRLAEGEVSAEEMDAGYCHENVAELWTDKSRGITGMGVGYALSEDGLWRQHSWAMRNEDIVETTAMRVKYFGVVLTGNQADQFAEANQGNVEERRWRRLPEVWFHLEKDEQGYPPREWEGLKCEPIDGGEAYRIKCIPFFVRGVAYEDLVAAIQADDGDHLVFKAHVSRSGYSNVRLWLSEGESPQKEMDKLVELGCLAESAVNFRNRLIAVAIPLDRLAEVNTYIDSGARDGRWGVEDGYAADAGN